MENTYFVYYDKDTKRYSVENSKLLSTYSANMNFKVVAGLTGLVYEQAVLYAKASNHEPSTKQKVEKTIMLISTTDRTSLINDDIITHSHHAYIGFDSYKPYFNAVGLDENTKLTIMFPNDDKGYMIITHWVSDMIDYLRAKMGGVENVKKNVTIYFNKDYIDEFPYIEFFENVKYY